MAQKLRTGSLNCHIFLMVGLITAFGLAGCGKPDSKPARDVTVTQSPATGQDPAAKPKTTEAPAATDAAKPASPAAKPPTGTPPKKAPATLPSAALTVPIYPGAKVFTGKTAADEAEAVKRSGAKHYVTGDSFDKVLGYYKTRMKGGVMRHNPNDKVKRALMVLPDKTKSTVQQVFVWSNDKQTHFLMSANKVPKGMIDQMGQIERRAPGPDGPGGPPQLPKTMKLNENKDLAAKKIGLPLYPGASIDRGAVVTDTREPGVEQVMVQASSKAKSADVLSWYKKELADKNPKEGPGPAKEVKTLQYSDDEKTFYTVMVFEREGTTGVMLSKMNRPKGMPPSPSGPRPGKGTPPPQ